MDISKDVIFLGHPILRNERKLLWRLHIKSAPISRLYPLRTKVYGLTDQQSYAQSHDVLVAKNREHLHLIISNVYTTVQKFGVGHPFNFMFSMNIYTFIHMLT